MRGVSLVVAFATACTGVSVQDGEQAESADAGALERAPCVPQSWPIVEDGHQLDRVTIEDAPGLAIYWVPPEPRGLVIMLHSNMHDASTMFTIEHEEFYNELAARDIAYVAVSNT